MEYHNVNYIPLLYNIFDEILMSILEFRVLHVKIYALHVNIKKDKCCISIRCYGVTLPLDGDIFDPWENLLPKNYSNIPLEQSIISRFIIRTYDGQHKYKKVLKSYSNYILHSSV
jgi:hypothetical protein